MRTMLSILFIGALLAFAPTAAQAGIPSIPNPATAGPLNPAWTGPALPAPLPFAVSPPLTNLIICPGYVVTAAALNFCGSLAGEPAPGNGVPSTVAGPNLSNTGNGTTVGTQSTSTTPPTTSACSVGSICVTAASNVCWNGTDGGVVGGVATTGPTGGFISGCGNASYFFGVLQRGDSIGSSLSDLTVGGTLTLTANCAGTPSTEDIVTMSYPQGVVASCSLPF